MKTIAEIVHEHWMRDSDLAEVWPNVLANDLIAALEARETEAHEKLREALLVRTAERDNAREEAESNAKLVRRCASAVLRAALDAEVTPEPSMPPDEAALVVAGAAGEKHGGQPVRLPELTPTEHHAALTLGPLAMARLAAFNRNEAEKWQARIAELEALLVSKQRLLDDLGAHAQEDNCCVAAAAYLAYQNEIEGWYKAKERVAELEASNARLLKERDFWREAHRDHCDVPQPCHVIDEAESLAYEQEKGR